MERAQALGREIQDHIRQLAEEAKLELDDEDMQSIFDRATSGNIGRAETEAAVKYFADRQKSLYDKWQKGYLASKQSPTAQIPNGSSATEVPDLKDDKKRREFFASILRGGE